MPTIVLTEAHATDQHPDMVRLSMWLTDAGVNPLWIAIPSEIRLERDRIVTREFERNGDEPVLRDGEYVVREGIYPPATQPLPVLRATEIRP